MPAFHFTPFNILLLALSISFGQFLRNNPMLFGLKTREETPSQEQFRIFRQHAILDGILEKHSSELGESYEAYRNHCLRVLSFAVYHLKENATDAAINLMATALAYHDIALWTDKKLDYLEPSVAVMEREIKNQQQDNNSDDSIPPKLNDKDMATAREIILQHHKYTEWKPPEDNDDDNSADPFLVNAARKADWADATYGIIRYGLPASYLEAAYVAIPEDGFHAILAGLGRKLSPDSFVRQFEVLRIFKW